MGSRKPSRYAAKTNTLTAGHQEISLASAVPGSQNMTGQFQPGHVRQSPSGVRRLIAFARLPSTPRIVACAVLSPASPQGDATLNLPDLLSCSLSKIAHSAGTPASRCASGSTAWRFHKGESAMVDGSPPAHAVFDGWFNELTGTGTCPVE